MSRARHIDTFDKIKAILAYFLDAAKLLLRYPAGFLKSMSGMSEMGKYMELRLHEDYQRKPKEITHARGFDIYLNPKDVYVSSHISIAKSYELSTTEIFARLIAKGSTVFDIGANVGWFTLLAARLSGPQGLVFSFEPEPTNFGLLSKSIELNKFKNTRLLQQCVSNIDGELTLYLTTAANMPGSHSTVRNFGMGSIAVKATRLDTIAENFGVDRIQLVKIDVEGAEPQVLLGATSLLRSSKINNMIMEWNPEAWTDRSELLDRIFKEFIVYEIGPPRPSPLIEIRRDALPTTKPNLYLRLRHSQ